MTYAVISHLDDVLPAIAGRDEFVHAQRDGYSVIDYNYALPDSFDDPIRLECRGLKFAPNGDLLARPFHKFFNIGERPDTQPHLIDLGQRHVVTEKMDGSMIHPAIIDGELVFMTRMGRTDHARQAERHITEDVESCCRILAKNGHTPIFEWTAPNNRIVVRYERSELTLLAIRHNQTGTYNTDLAGWAQDMGVSAVREHRTPTDTAEFLEHVRALRDMEGFVVRFSNGLWVKAKAEDYVLKHKAKDSVLQEKNVLALILRGEIDDVLPLLDGEDLYRVQDYAVQVEHGIETTASRVRGIVGRRTRMDQKHFALDIAEHVPAKLRPLAFQVRAGTDARTAVVAMVLRKATSQTGVDECRDLFHARFEAPAVVLETAA